MQRCRINAQICYQCEKQNEICQHPPPTLRDKIRDLFRRRILRPFILIASMFFFAAFCGISPYRPYIVQILYFYKSPIDPNQVVVWLGYIGLAANVSLVITIRSLGKRSIYLWSMAFTILTLFGLGNAFHSSFDMESIFILLFTICLIFYRHLWLHLPSIRLNVI